MVFHRRVCRAVVVAVAISLGTADVYGQDVFSGVIDAELVTPDSGGTPVLCKRLTREDVPTQMSGRVFGCVASWYLRQGQLHISLRFVEPDAGGYPVLFVDANQDGVFSEDERFAFVKIAVFRIGKRYVSTDRTDLLTRTVTIGSRNRGDYRRLELRRRMTIPDFGFAGVDGQTHWLSEFRNRHVLLFFWYGGCGPCAEQLSYVRAARARYPSSSLAIVGLMADNTPVETLRPIMVPNGPFDAHADPRRARALVEEWFGISVLPTQLLLDPQGRIVSLNQQEYGRHALYGDSLLRTLRALLPGHANRITILARQIRFW